MDPGAWPWPPGMISPARRGARMVTPRAALLRDWSNISPIEAAGPGLGLRSGDAQPGHPPPVTYSARFWGVQSAVPWAAAESSSDARPERAISGRGARRGAPVPCGLPVRDEAVAGPGVYVGFPGAISGACVGNGIGTAADATIGTTSCRGRRMDDRDRIRLTSMVACAG